MSLADGDDDSGDLSDLLGVGNIGKAAVEVGELSMLSVVGSSTCGSNQSPPLLTPTSSSGSHNN
jgi:hypothetical protein